MSSEEDKITSEPLKYANSCLLLTSNTNFFEVFSASNQEKRVDISIPETIIYKHGVATHWFKYSSKNKTVESLEVTHTSVFDFFEAIVLHNLNEARGESERSRGEIEGKEKEDSEAMANTEYQKNLFYLSDNLVKYPQYDSRLSLYIKTATSECYLSNVRNAIKRLSGVNGVSWPLMVRKTWSSYRRD